MTTALRLVATTVDEPRPVAAPVRSQLLRTRAEIDRLLESLPEDEPPPRGPTGRTRGADPARPVSRDVIAELAGVTAERPALLRGPVQQLCDLDATERTQYVRTLRAYFDAGQDVQRASRAMFVHRNTMRYRLGRIRTLTGLDLRDPVDRLVAELQLRLHDLRGAS